MTVTPVDPPRPALARVLRAYPLTLGVALLGTLVFAAQVAQPAVVGALQRSPDIVHGGQWWRLIGALLVQPSGWGQFAYNTLGLLLVGAAVERAYGRLRWLLVFLASGLAGGVFMLVLRPADSGGGSSDAVAGLIGALVVLAWRTRRLPPLPTLLYAAHFAVYLSVLAAWGVLAATVAGTLALAAAAAAHRAGLRRPLTAGLAALVLTAAVAMAVIGDAHGAGLLTGLALTALPLVRPPA
ncbi:rhomboid family intramembrane serine protease [Catellatospora bangladeshensis]|uniref:rhomboid family intramembrane serine protease n=1 Tax=Catellatospora bangladeshensis TaxID=310355 RepID=UPI0019427E0A|nr:rhomboid family intramembrane serine protease [Catellatospora bangladeshensis]